MIICRVGVHSDYVDILRYKWTAVRKIRRLKGKDRQHSRQQPFIICQDWPWC